MGHRGVLKSYERVLEWVLPQISLSYRTISNRSGVYLRSEPVRFKGGCSYSSWGLQIW